MGKEEGFGSTQKGLDTREREREVFFACMPNQQGGQQYQRAILHVVTNGTGMRARQLLQYVVPIREPTTLLPFSRPISLKMGEGRGLVALYSPHLSFAKG